MVNKLENKQSNEEVDLKFSVEESCVRLMPQRFLLLLQKLQFRRARGGVHRVRSTTGKTARKHRQHNREKNQTTADNRLTINKISQKRAKKVHGILTPNERGSELERRASKQQGVTNNCLRLSV